MSGIDGQEPVVTPPTLSFRRRGRWWRWPGTAVILLAEGSLLFVAVGGSALAWRAAQGPVDLSWLLPKIGRVIAVAQPDLDVGIGHLAIAWNGFTRGPDQPVQLVAKDLHMADAAAGRRVTIDSLAVDLSAAWAVRGVAAPRIVAIVNPHITLRQTLPMATAEARPEIVRQHISLKDVLHILAGPPATDQHLVPAKPQALSQLRRLTVTGGEVTLEPAPDAQGHVPPNLKAAALALVLTRAEAGGVAGQFSTTLAASPGAQAAGLTGTLTLGTDASLRVQAQTTIGDPARLMAAVGISADAPVIALPVSASADVSVGPDLAIVALKASVKGGAGKVVYGGGTIPVTAISLGVSGDRQHLVSPPMRRSSPCPSLHQRMSPWGRIWRLSR